MPTNDENRLRNLLDLRTQTASKTWRELAERADTNEAYLSQIANQLPDSKSRKPKAVGDKLARKLEKGMGKERGWMDQEHGTAVVASAGAPVDGPDTAIPMLDVRVSAGPGDVRPEDDPIVGSMRLNTLWVRRHLPMITGIQNLVTVIAHGRSMEPTFCDGSILLVDQGVNEIRVDGIYVLAFNSELYVKRVTRRLPDGALLVSSDNPLHQGFTIENGSRESVQVLGRVVWAFDSKGV
ncbi:MAG: S24 family peptidase [Pseudomonadota bacterium]